MRDAVETMIQRRPRVERLKKVFVRVNRRRLNAYSNENENSVARKKLRTYRAVLRRPSGSVCRVGAGSAIRHGLAIALVFLLGCAWIPKIPRPNLKIPVPSLPKIDIPLPSLEGFCPKLPRLNLARLNPFHQEQELGTLADPQSGVEVIQDDGAIASFHRRTMDFYGQLANRRFNSIQTYRDEKLRAFFRNEDEFSDYYADFANGLTSGHFERSLPLSLEVVEFMLDAPGAALVTVRLIGHNNLPLRCDEVEYQREDRWERYDSVWWIVPAKL